MKNIESIKQRWVDILRQKASYEHEERKKGKVVASPSIDDICNEMEAFFSALSLIESKK